jgi:hypothetical protein
VYVRIERRRHPDPSASPSCARAAARRLGGYGSADWPLLARYLLAALSLMVALNFLSSLNARAESKVEVDEGGALLDSDDTGGGMPSSNPRVHPILAAHPDQFVVICVAGCDGKPHAVQILPRSGAVTARAGGYVPSMGKMGKESYGPPRPAHAGGTASEANDVVCLAGCIGRPGQVVERITDLPPPRRARKQ